MLLTTDVGAQGAVLSDGVADRFSWWQNTKKDEHQSLILFVFKNKREFTLLFTSKHR